MRLSITKKASLAVGTAFAACLTFVTPAHANNYYVTWQDLQTHRCLSQGPYVNLETSPDNCGAINAFGQWNQWQNNDDGTYTYSNNATGKCLDSNDYGSAYLLDCNFGDYQRWYVISVGDGHFLLQDKKTHRYLDSNYNGAVYTSTLNGGDYQRWW